MFDASPTAGAAARTTGRTTVISRTPAADFRAAHARPRWVAAAKAGWSTAPVDGRGRSTARLSLPAMRLSHLFFATLRDDPADAEMPSHRLLVRAGYVRQLGSGIYSLLPLGKRVSERIEQIIREEQDRIGGQEMHMPVVHPADIWQASGRYDAIGPELARFKDRTAGTWSWR